MAFRHPRRFWPAMTVSLSAAGLVATEARGARLPPGARAWLAGGAVSGALGYLAAAAGARWLGTSSLGARWLDQMNQGFASAPRRWAALLAVPAAVGEEVFWRETYLAHCLRLHSGATLPAGARCTLAYAASQLPARQPLPALGAIALGGGMALLRLRSGSVWPAAAAHLVFSELCLVFPGLPKPTQPVNPAHINVTTP